MAEHFIIGAPIPNDLKSVYQVRDEPTDKPRLLGLSQMNLFVGPNNSGKSRLLRGLFASLAETADYYIQFDRLPDLVRMLEPIKESSKHFARALDASPYNNIDVKSAQKIMSERILPILTRSDKKTGWSKEELSSLPDVLDELSRFSQNLSGYVKEEYDLTAQLYNNRDKIKNAAKASFETLPHRQLRKLYFPSLRSVRKVGSGVELEERTKTDYFSGRGRLFENERPAEQSSPHRQSRLHPLAIESGQGIFVEVRRHLLGSLVQRQRIRQYEEYLGSTFFNGREVVLIPKEGGDALHIKVGKEKEYPIHDLGDGLQQLLMLTFPLYLHEDDDLLFFVEEPELFMHAGYQRLLIDAWMNASVGKSVQIFATTHSSHFLDLTLDFNRIAVFRLAKEVSGEGHDQEKEASFTIERRSGPDFKILAELGIRNSSVLLSNCTIWVEGVTDRQHIRHYLKLYQDQLDEGQPRFYEDMHFSFVEYGGGNITHWSFLNEESGINVDHLCGRLMLIADCDEGKDDRHDKLREALEERFILLSCKEVENLVSPDVLKRVIQDYEGETAGLNDVEYSDYKTKSIGTFIDKNILVEESKRRKHQGNAYKYADKSGTIKDKSGFAERAVRETQAYNDMTPEAQEIAQKLYSFISSHNELPSS